MTATRPSRFRAKSPASLLPVLAGRPRWPLPITNTEHVPSRGRRISPSLPAVVEREQEPPRRIRNIFGIYSACLTTARWRAGILLSWNGSLVPRFRFATTPDQQKHDPDLQINRAAYRNRTDDLRITRVFSCVARGFKTHPTFMFADCCWWRSLAVDGSSGASRGHAPVVRRPSSRSGDAVERPSVFQAGHIPSWHGSCGCCALSPVADRPAGRV